MKYNAVIEAIELIASEADSTPSEILDALIEHEILTDEDADELSEHI